MRLIPKFVLIVLIFFLNSSLLAKENEANAENTTQKNEHTEPQNQTKNQKKEGGKESKESKEEKNLSYFDTVNLSGVGNLYIKQSDKPSFTIEADKKILPSFNVYVKDKVLYIDLKNAQDYAEAKINYHLTVKDLKNINSFSTSSIFIENSFETPELNVSLNNFGEAYLFVNLAKLNAKIEGGGKIIIRGLAAEQNIEISGAGEFMGSKLVGKNVTVNLSGSAIAKVNASDNLVVKIEGEGSVKYCGKPNIQRDIMGNKGTINPDIDC